MLADRYGVELRARAGGPAGGGPPPAAAPPGAAAGAHRRLLRQLPLGVQGGRQGARVPGRARPRRGRRCATSGSATRPAPGTRSSSRGQQAGFSVGEMHGVGLAQRNQQGRRVRPLPLADHVPDPRPPRPHARLRRPGDALRPGRQVREHGGDRLLPQEPDALRASTWRKAAIAKAGRAVVVEGYTDVLALHQAGIEEAVGVMGTAITGEQVATLSGMVERGGAGARRRLGRPGGDAARPAGRRRAADAAAGRGDAGRGRPGRDDGRGGRRRALPRRWSRRPGS